MPLNPKVKSTKILIGLALAVILGGYFVFFYQICSAVIPPSRGPDGPFIGAKGGKPYRCETLFEKIAGFDNKQPTGCTLDAMLCPDSSAVGRTGPNCEFAKCPGGGAYSLNTTALNQDRDFWGLNMEDSIALYWTDVPSQSTQLRIFRSTSENGPWVLVVSTVSDGVSNAVDGVNGEEADLYYRLEAVSETGIIAKQYKILRIPKYIDESSPDSTSWKTYRNEKYGFEVRYPPDFIVSSGSNVDWDEFGKIKRVVQIPPYPETPGAIKVYIIDDKNHIFSEDPAPVDIREYVPFVTEPRFASIVENDLSVHADLKNILRIGYESFKNKQVHRVYWKPDTTNIWRRDHILVNHKGKTLTIYYRTDKKIFKDIVDSLKFLE